MDQTVSVTLDAGIVYVSGTVNGTAVTWTQVDDTTWEAICDKAENNAYAVEITAINSLGTTITKSFTIYYGLNLVYDRKRSDVINGTEKGYYNASDLNRVESAVSFLCSLLREVPEELEAYGEEIGVAWDSFFDLPYDPADFDLTTKLDWTIYEFPTATEMQRYLDNVETLIGAIEVAYPALPDSMGRLDYTGANNIERSLQILYDALFAEKARITDLLERTSQTFVYCGQPYSGEIWDQIV